MRKHRRGNQRRGRRLDRKKLGGVRLPEEHGRRSDERRVLPRDPDAREQMSSGGFPSLLQGRRFFCREWALEKLRRCLDTRSIPGQPPGLLVTGGPGAGKTALCTEVVRPTSEAGLAAGLAPRCLASHFCQREDQRSTSRWRFVLGLVEQLRASALLSPGYQEILDSPSVSSCLEPVACQRDPDNTFKRFGSLFILSFFLFSGM